VTIVDSIRSSSSPSRGPALIEATGRQVFRLIDAELVGAIRPGRFSGSGRHTSSTWSADVVKPMLDGLLKTSW